MTPREREWSVIRLTTMGNQGADTVLKVGISLICLVLFFIFVDTTSRIIMFNVVSTKINVCSLKLDDILQILWPLRSDRNLLSEVMGLSFNNRYNT